MYTFVSSWVKPAKYNSPYANVDLSGVTLYNILRDYFDGYIELSNPALTRTVFLELKNIRRDEVPVNLNQTLRTWLVSIGSFALTTLRDRPAYLTRSVLSRDAILAGFKVDLCEPNKRPESDASVGNKTNLFVSKPVGGKGTLQTRVLTTVNGFLHLNRPYQTGIQVHDGGRSMLHSGRNHVGLLSFEHIGDVMQIPLTSDNVNKYTAATPMSKKIMIDLDVSLENKSVILSLGGYMFVSPSFVTVVSDTTGLLEVDLSRIDIPLKMLQSFEYIDLLDVGLVEVDKVNLDFGRIRISDVTSDIAMSKWLTISQSFVIVVDTPSLTVRRVPTQKTGVYGVFETHENPYLPLVDNYGRLREYWVKRQHDAWIIQVSEPTYHPRLYETGMPNDITFVNQVMPGQSEYLQPMDFLNIISTKKM